MHVRAIFVLTVCAAPLLVASNSHAQQPDTHGAAAGQANVEAGRAVAVGNFLGTEAAPAQQSACFQCHGMDGRGDVAAAFPRLTDQSETYLHESLKAYASGQRNNPVMTPIAQALNDRQMRDVSAYYAAQDEAPYDPRPEATSEQLQLGGAIAAVGSATSGVQACINCHGPEGAGLEPYPYLAGQHAAYLEAQLQAWRTGARRGGLGSGVMELIAKRLSDSEITALALYYASLRPKNVTPETETPQQAFAPRGDNAIQPTR